ncbi:MAG: cytochrome C [Leptospirillia bacterium]
MKRINNPRTRATGAAIAITMLLSLLAGCAGAPTPLPQGESESAVLYRNACGACHSVPHPARHTAEQWEHLLTLMEVRMAERGMAFPEPDARSRILGYLKAHAR